MQTLLQLFRNYYFAFCICLFHVSCQLFILFQRLLLPFVLMYLLLLLLLKLLLLLLLLMVVTLAVASWQLVRLHFRLYVCSQTHTHSHTHTEHNKRS